MRRIKHAKTALPTPSVTPDDWNAPLVDESGAVIDLYDLGIATDVRAYGAIGNGVADDTSAIQAAIQTAHMAGGGQIFLPTGTYKLTSSLVLRSGVSIRGIYPGLNPLDPTSWDLRGNLNSGTIFTFPDGAVFSQDMSGGLGILSKLDGIIIESLGFNDVGSVMVCGATNKSGFCGSVLRDLLATNVTGVAYDLTNSMEIHVSNIKASNAYQFLRFTGDYDGSVVYCQPGNSYFADLFGYASGAGQGQPTIHIRTLNPGGNGTCMDLLRFTNVQINRYGTAKIGHHLRIEGATPTAYILECIFDGLDFEGWADAKIWLNNVAESKFVITGDFPPGCSNSDLYARNARLNNVTCLHDGVILDMDASCVPMTWNGAMAGVTGGGYFPQGIWHDATLNVPRLGFNAWGQSIVANSDWSWDLPTTYLNFANGGDVRQRTLLGQNGANLQIDPYLMGYIELTGVAQAIVLGDATICRGQRFTLKKTSGAGTATLSTVGGQTIDGATTNIWLDGQYKYIALQSDGNNWLIVGKG